MQVVLLGDVVLYDVAEVLVEVRQGLQQLLVRLLDAAQHVVQICTLAVVFVGTQAVRHELVDLDRVVVLMHPVDSQTQRTDQTLAPAVGVDAHERGVLVVELALVRFYEFLERLAEGV